MGALSGVVARSAEEAFAAVRVMNDTQAHRGPDAAGQRVVEFDRAVIGLGHRRLAVKDPSPLGHQPMAHPDTGDLLVVNGELFNHAALRRSLEREGVRFRSSSDSEVMLHALVRWGPQSIEHFEGMFALAFLRRKDHRLLLARDHAGIKPLYTAWTPGAFVFASEVRAVLASGLVDRGVSSRAIATMLAYGAVQEPETIFQAVKAFPAGCWQEIDLESTLGAAPAAPRRFWAPPPVDEGIAEEEAVQRTRVALDRAVCEQLEADVDVGVFLSSGLDSTICAGIAARHRPGTKAYTVGFVDNQDLSESPAAAEIARVFGLEHVDVQVTASDALASVTRWLSSMDQPSMDGLNTYVLSHAVQETGLKVALSGVGGDELFGGYPSFEDVPRLQRAIAAVHHLPKPLRAIVAYAISTGQSDAYRQKLIEIARTDGRLVELYFQRRRTMSTTQLTALGIDAHTLGLSELMLPHESLSDLNVDDQHPIPGISALETRYYCGNMLLRDTDASSMAHGLEVRVPFLDKRVMEAIMPVQGSVRLPNRHADKYLLRAAFPDLLGPAMPAAGKRGFELPIRRWMATNLRPFCEAALSNLKSCGVLDPRGINAVWQQFIHAPQSQAWSRAFTLCVLGSYIAKSRAVVSPRQSGASIPTAPALRLRGGFVA